MNIEDSTTALPLPEWLESRRVSEELFTLAYDNCGSKNRAALKTGLAFASFHFNGYRLEERCEIKNPLAGFDSVQIRRPYEWCAIFFEASFSASARLCAAAILPVLANVRNIFAIAIGGEPSLNALASLELCGIDDVFQLSEKEAQGLISEMSKAESSRVNGKICLIHSGQKTPSWLASESGLPFCALSANVNIQVQNTAIFDLDALAYAQNWKPGDFNPAKSIDCIFADKLDAIEEHSPSIVFGPGLEGCWLYPGLGPEDFSRRLQGFFMPNE